MRPPTATLRSKEVVADEATHGHVLGDWFLDANVETECGAGSALDLGLGVEERVIQGGRRISNHPEAAEEQESKTPVVCLARRLLWRLSVGNALCLFHAGLLRCVYA